MLASSAEKASMLAEQRVFVYDISLRKPMIGTTNHQYRIGRLRKLRSYRELPFYLFGLTLVETLQAYS